MCVSQLTDVVSTKMYSFSAHGHTYAVVLNEQWTGALTSTVGSDGAVVRTSTQSTNPSLLYRWHGSMVLVQVGTKS